MLGLGATSERPETQDAVSRITKNILLTNVWNALDLKLLADHGVTHVVSAMKEHHIPRELQAKAWFKQSGHIPWRNREGRYLRPRRLEVPLDDSPDAPLLALLEKAVDFMREAVALNEDAVILVHCFQGVSRSSSLVIAYLMDVEDMTFQEALGLVRAKRPQSPTKSRISQTTAWLGDRTTGTGKRKERRYG